MATQTDNGHSAGGNKPTPAAADSLDLTAFLGGLQREIHDLHTSIKASRDGRVEKAFQRLPRNMRRRTASHNAKRLPRRLRQQARRDQVADNTPSVAAGLAKRKKGRTASAWVYENTKKRIRLQQEKTLAAAGRAEDDEDADMDDNDNNDNDNGDDAGGGALVAAASPRRLLPIKNLRLPTHQWHSKRARIANPGALWNALVVQTPANKTYRMALRSAGLRPGMCVCRDTSYMATLFVTGPAAQLDATLSSVVEPHLLTPALRRGVCCVDVKLPRAFGYQKRQDDGAAGTVGELGGPGNCGAMTLFYNPTSEAIAHDTPRAAFLRVHPTVLANVWTTLQREVAQAKRPVVVRDFRLEVGSIDVTGSAAAEALAATLYPYQAPNGAPLSAQALDFLRLRSLDTTALAAASGALLAFDIQDPRLDEPDQPTSDDNNNGGSFGRALAAWPTSAGEQAARHPSGLFNADVRHKATRQLPQSTLDRRRGALDAGEKLLLRPAENHPIPVLVGVVGPSVPAAADPNRRRRGGGGGGSYVAASVPPTWTVLAPRLCIDSIWRRLVLHRLTRNGGQRPQCAGLDEDRHMALERGDPWFPADFPGTAAGWDWELQSRVRLAAAWKAKPSSKRPQWTALDLGNGAKRGELGSGFACDWEHLFGVDAVPTTTVTETTTTTTAPAAAEDETEDEAVQFAALRPGEQPDLVRQMQHATWAAVRATVQATRLQRPPLWRSPYQLLTVSVQMLRGGVPNPLARIYRLPAAASASASSSSCLRAGWLAQARSYNSRNSKNGQPPPRRPKKMPVDASLATRKQLLAQSLLETPALPYPRPPPPESSDGAAQHLPVPGAADLIGFVTSGAHRFQIGKGFGIGHVGAVKLVEAIRATDAEEVEDDGDDDETNDGEKGRVHIPKEARLCIVRNVGERVGHLARWTPISH